MYDVNRYKEFVFERIFLSLKHFHYAIKHYLLDGKDQLKQHGCHEHKRR